ncbi:MAG: peptidoglycan editing factor PgeF [Neisseriaceae bacterium]|nr:peptidoglycan editing factor PgeF [Neisseriaceae bacterium]
MEHMFGFAKPDQALFKANWPAPKNVKTLISTRNGGVSKGEYASLNVGEHVGDEAKHVAENRRRVQANVPVPLQYLNQVHSAIVVDAKADAVAVPAADASVAKDASTACAVMTADCLPVLLCNRQGTVVAAAHAGWRGLANDVLAETVAKMGCDPLDVMVYLGPAIGPDAFEVGQDVWDAFCVPHPHAITAFQDIGNDKYLANIYDLAKVKLKDLGVTQIYGGDYCTVLQRDLFFSYRRDGQTGRMVSAIWLQD